LEAGAADGAGAAGTVAGGTAARARPEAPGSGGEAVGWSGAMEQAYRHAGPASVRGEAVERGCHRRRRFVESLKINVARALIAVQQAAPAMRSRGSGTLLTSGGLDLWLNAPPWRREGRMAQRRLQPVQGT
jgi:hypothetical protein